MERTKEMQDFLDSFTESAFGTKIDGPVCVTCRSTKIKSGDFRDDLSRKEFGISHMCQQCQDDVFGTD